MSAERGYSGTETEVLVDAEDGAIVTLAASFYSWSRAS